MAARSALVAMRVVACAAVGCPGAVVLGQEARLPRPLTEKPAAEDMADRRARNSSEYGDGDVKPPARLVYHEATIRNRTGYILANLERLSAMPIDGLVVNVPASWLLMSGERWSYAESFGPWIEPLVPVLNDPERGLVENYLLAVVDRPADFLGDWSVAEDNFHDLARAARDGGFAGIVIDNEQYQTPLWDWPSTVDDPEAGRAAYEAAARSKGVAIGAAMADAYPDIRVMFLHGPYIADPEVPGFVRGNQFGVGEFELFGPFYAGVLEGLGPRATLIDGGEVYALRTREEFRSHALWRRWGLSSSAHDAAFLSASDRERHRERIDISFGVYTRPFPLGLEMNPDILRDTLEHALRGSDSITWLYSEEGLSLWEPTEFTPEWTGAVAAAREASLIPRPRLRFGVDDVHAAHLEPFDADLNGRVDEEDLDAVIGECRLLERRPAERHE